MRLRTAIPAPRQAARAAALMLALSLAACGPSGSDAGGDDATADTVAAADPADPAPPAAPSAAESAPDDTALSLTAADLDAYERGKRAEAEFFEALAVDMRKAKSAMDTMGIRLRASTNEPAEAGAKAARMPLARYSRVTSAIEGALGAGSLDAMMKQQMAGMDTTGMDEASKAQMRENMAGLRKEMDQNRERQWAAIPADLRPALAQRAPRLDSLKARNLAALMAMAR